MAASIRLSETLPAAAAKAVAAAQAEWSSRGDVRRLWTRDSSLWTGADETKWLGWLDIAEREYRDVGALAPLTRHAREYRDVVLIGMGGSSLGPDVIAQTFGPSAGWPRFRMLDSTDPDQIGALERAIEPSRTLFIVSSKSGTTLEPNILKDYFLTRAGADAARRFVAVTDPGSAMEREARSRGFAHLFFGDPAIGGRYSVLSKFGLVPAAAAGIDVAALLAAAIEAARACADGADSPGLRLGLILGVLAANFGRDKVTVLASPRLASVGSWLEQLFAESTGKHGKGLIPIDGEPAGAPTDYGADRVFIYLKTKGEADATQGRAIDALAAAGQPVVRLEIDDLAQLGDIFFTAEFATAVAGAVIGINPFDQPDVEASKVKTRALTDAYEQSGKLPAEEPFFTGDGVALFADAANARALRSASSLAAILRAHLARAHAGDYLALLAYIDRNDAHTKQLDELRVRLRHATQCATCLGFGPRFLHSTGQAYKGGPNSGVFVQITADTARDLAVPGKKYSFGVVELAQAQGDFAVLNERGRRALRVHLANKSAGLDLLFRAFDDAMKG